MSRTIADLTAGAEIYIDEYASDGVTVEHVPYIYLGLDESSNARVLRKNVVEDSPLNMHDEAVASYDGCAKDVWLQSWAESKFSSATINCLKNTSISYVDYDGGTTGQAHTISRKCFLLSHTEIGFTSVAGEGQSYLSALKTYYNTTSDDTARSCTDYGNTGRAWWTRSASDATKFYCTNSTGRDMGGYVATNTGTGIRTRPALSINPTTLVSDVGAEQIALLPSGSFTTWGVSASMSLGKTATRAKRGKLIVDVGTFQSIQFWVCNNYMDTNPTWVSCTNGGTAEMGSSKTAVDWELGVKVQATATAINQTIREPIMIVELEPEVES